MKNFKLLRRQRHKFLVYNLLAFFVIFFILGFVAAMAIDGFFYRNTDKLLQQSRNFLIEQAPSFSFWQGTDADDKSHADSNPRMGFIIYSADTMDTICANMPENIVHCVIKFPDGEDRTYNIKLDEYNYRMAEFTIKAEGETFFAQVLINIDAEILLRNNIMRIYLICISAIVIIATAASYILSSVTLVPVKKSMDDQIRFVSDAAHELRTPLTALHSRLEHLLTEPDAKIIDKSAEVSDCLAEVMRLTKLSNSLLTLAKSDADKVLPDISKFDVFELIQKVASPYIEIAEFQEKTFEVSGVSTMVTADPAKLMQVFVTLFDNALKYTASGDRISVSLAKVKSKCEITVVDTGIGISAKGLPRVFERFYRDDNSRGTSEGSGLGLAIAKQIIEEHGGTITVRANHPKGTIFVVSI